ncbi:MAG: alpha/beta fold hydrolase, partial [Bdellovibrionota bacterium]
MAEEPRIETRKLTKVGSLETNDGWGAGYRFKPGVGETIVFLNGLGDDLESWSVFADQLGERQTLQVDLRGQGRSLAARMKTHPGSDYRIPIGEQSRDLLRVMDEVGIAGKVALCGFSYGGGIALDFASRFPERVSTLALIVPFVIRLDRAFPMQRIFTWQWRTLKAAGVLPTTLSSTLEKGYEEFLSAYMNQRYERRLADPEARKVAVQLSHGIMEFDTFEILGN